MKLKQSFLVALALLFLALITWEIYWRSQGYYPTIDDNKALWAVQRSKVEFLTSEDVILTGSSRVHFDIQLDVFEDITGKRPLQLAVPGSSPLPIFHDIVNNTEFNGTIIVGVTPPLFFSTTYPKAEPWHRAQSKVEHYHDRTFAERLNHQLSLPLQSNLVMMSGHEEKSDENIDLKGLLRNIKFKKRTPGPAYPPFFEFGDVSIDRNVRMSKQCATDTVFSNKIKNAWKFILTSEGPPPDKNSTTNYFAKDAKKFTERGGNLILVRCPSSGMFYGGEKQFFSRETFFDSLVNVTKARAYHYEDYEQLKSIDCCPEWSHLSAENADIFSKELVNIMLEDGAITNYKTK